MIGRIERSIAIDICKWVVSAERVVGRRSTSREAESTLLCLVAAKDYTAVDSTECLLRFLLRSGAEWVGIRARRKSSLRSTGAVQSASRRGRPATLSASASDDYVATSIGCDATNEFQWNARERTYFRVAICEAVAVRGFSSRAFSPNIEPFSFWRDVRPRKGFRELD